MRLALRPSILVGQDRGHESAPSQHPSGHSHSRGSPLSRGRPELTRLYELGFGAAVAPGLTEHAHRVWTDDNAGGSSRNSEAMSMELLRHASTSKDTITHRSEHRHMSSSRCTWCTYSAWFTSLVVESLLHIAAPRLLTEICTAPAPTPAPPATTPALHLHHLHRLRRAAAPSARSCTRRRCSCATSRRTARSPT